MTKSFIFTILFILLLGACTNGIMRSLADANRLINENPDSALKIVESINPEDLGSDSEKALYALLLTEARYKTGFDETNDSLISIATDYYHLQDKNPLRARAYYQKGLVNINAKEYSDGLLALMIAEETAISNEDTLSLALIHRSIGDAFGKIENPKSAISYYQKSYDEFSSINDSIYALYALYDLARSNYNATNYIEAIDLSKQLLGVAESRNNRDLMAYTLELLGDACEIINDYKNSIDYLTRLRNEYSYYIKPQSWNSLGLAYLKSGNLYKAKECEDTLKKISSDQWWLSYRIAEVTHDYPKALELLKVEYYDNNEIALDWVSRRSEKGLFDQYVLLKQSANREKKENGNRLLLVILIGCLIVLISFFLIKRLKNKNIRLSIDNKSLSNYQKELQKREKELLNELETNQITIMQLKDRIKSQEREIFGLRAKTKGLGQEIEELQNEINKGNDYSEKLKLQLDELMSEQSVREKAIEEVRTKLKSAVSSKFDFFDRLMKVYYNSGANEYARREVSADFVLILKEMQENKKLIRELEGSIDYYYDNLMSNFKRDYPKLNEFEYQIYLFLVLGFSPKAISALQGIWTDTFYNRKSALLKKIKAGLTKSTVNYLDYI